MKALAYLTPAFIRSHHTCENHRGVSMVYAKDPAIFQAQVPPLDVAQLMKALAQALCRWNRRRDHADRHWSAGGAARAASGHATAAPPSSVMNVRRFIRSPRWRGRATHMQAEFVPRAQRDHKRPAKPHLEFR